VVVGDPLSPPFTVDFTDESNFAPTHRLWEFDDGSFPSEDSNPSHIFHTTGPFYVKLTSWRTTSSRNRRGTTVSSPRSFKRLIEFSTTNENSAYTNFFSKSIVNQGAGNRPLFDESFNFVYHYFETESVWYHDYISSETYLNYDLTPYPFASNMAVMRYDFYHNSTNLISATFTHKLKNTPFPNIVFDTGGGHISGDYQTVANAREYLGTNVVVECSNLDTFSNRLGFSGLIDGGEPANRPFGLQDAKLRVYTFSFLGTKTKAIPYDWSFSGNPRGGKDNIDSELQIENFPGTISSVKYFRRPSNIKAEYPATPFATIINPTENFDVTKPNG
jgi:PKD repeat protein